MSDNDSIVDVPSNSEGILKQINAEIAKSKLSSVKNLLKEKLQKIDEHKKAIRQIEAEVTEILAKHEAGI